MKLDTHAHTWHSADTTTPLLHNVMRESYNTPERVYAVAKARGMDLVAITDHDQISGALALGHRPGVVVGCEVTGAARIALTGRRSDLMIRPEGGGTCTSSVVSPSR